jgi:putative ABC transport system substrate-binding protein
MGLATRAGAQENRRVYRLGLLIPVSRDVPAVAAFFDELSLHGISEGQNLTVIVRQHGSTREQLQQSVAALVDAAPDVIIGGPELPLSALKAATRVIPIVGMSEDMIAEGLVTSLARPGGNITGISILSPGLDGKRQDILIEATPGLSRMAAFADASVTSEHHLQELRDAARGRGVSLMTYSVRTPDEVLPAMDAAVAAGARALNFLATPMFSIPGSNRPIRERAANLRAPAMFQWPEAAEEGGLLAYGPRFADMFRQRARMVVKVLRGVRPADLPVEQPTKFELVVNLKTAKAIGHEIPATLVLRAHTVIE